MIKANLLVEKINQAVENVEFPFWEDGEENAYTGKMKMSGFISESRLDLIFETFEFSLSENVIQSLVYHISTEDILNFVISTEWHETIHIDVAKINFQKPFTIDLYDTFNLTLNSDQISLEHRLNREHLTPEALLFYIVDTVDDSFIFLTEQKLKALLSIQDSKLLFSTTSWEHPNFEAVMVDESKSVLDYPDIEAVIIGFENSSLPIFSGTNNNDWRLQYISD